MKVAVHAISIIGSLTNLIMHANIFPFRQDRYNCMKREVNEPLKVLESGRDERRKPDHRHCRIIEIGRPIFDRKYNFSVQN
jgi:hypothetical protein